MHPYTLASILFAQTNLLRNSWICRTTWNFPCSFQVNKLPIKLNSHFELMSICKWVEREGCMFWNKNSSNLCFFQQIWTDVRMLEGRTSNSAQLLPASWKTRTDYLKRHPLHRLQQARWIQFILQHPHLDKWRRRLISCKWQKPTTEKRKSFEAKTSTFVKTWSAHW